MKIELAGEVGIAGLTNDLIVEFAHELFWSAAKRIQLSEAMVDVIVLASESEYGPSIRKIDRDASFTNDAMNTAVAKTIQPPTTCGTNSPSSVVFRVDYLLAAMALFDPNATPRLLSLADQVVYAVGHELGHCKDNWLRKQRPAPSKKDLAPFSVKSLADYYFYIFQSEFAACAHSGNEMSGLVFQQDISTLKSHIEQHVKQLTVSSARYDGSGEALRTLAYEAGGAVWYILIQYGKLLGSCIENRSLSRLAIEQLEAETGIPALNEFGSFCYSYWNNYPKWDADVVGAVYKSWDEITQHVGFRFVSNRDGTSSLFLR